MAESASVSALSDASSAEIAVVERSANAAAAAATAKRFDWRHRFRAVLIHCHLTANLVPEPPRRGRFHLPKISTAMEARIWPDPPSYGRSADEPVCGEPRAQSAGGNHRIVAKLPGADAHRLGHERSDLLARQHRVPR